MGWQDDVEAGVAAEDRKSQRTGLLVGLAVVSVLAVGYQLSTGSAPAPAQPPPQGEIYREVGPEIIGVKYSSRTVTISVNASWQGLERGARSERIVGLLERTGSVEFDELNIVDPEGNRVAVAYEDGTIRWFDAY